MSGETVITHIGNLVEPVELKFTPAGVAVANFTVAATPRLFDRTTNEWKDGQALFLRCNIWREPAENLANSELVKGTRLIVCGRLKQRTYETSEGEKRYVTELDVEEVGPALKWATAKVQRLTRTPAGAGAPLPEGQPLDPPF
nr:single-stranded DNA-binding protein [Nocardia brasiliensis]